MREESGGGREERTEKVRNKEGRLGWRTKMREMQGRKKRRGGDKKGMGEGRIEGREEKREEEE